MFLALKELSVDFKYSYTLDRIATLFRSPTHVCIARVLAVRAVPCSCIVCCLFLSWFAKEANVANNNNNDVCCEPGNDVTSSLEQVARRGVRYKRTAALVAYRGGRSAV